MTFRPCACLRASLTSTTVSTIAAARRPRCAVRTSASVSLGKQEPPIARAGMQELAADAAVEADAARHVVHVGADLLAEIGDLVDEGDLGREEGVGGVLDQLGRLELVNTIGVSIR